MHDEEHYPNPELYDPFRFSRPLEAAMESEETNTENNEGPTGTRNLDEEKV
jgi:hypothetical protein